VEKEEIPRIIRPNRQRGESKWQRFWRRRRMNSIRNSSDHAVFTAVSLFLILLAVGLLAFFGMRGAQLGGPSPSGTEMFLR
jgi:hypothetical protein